jgi:hypothetical protein
MAGHDAAAFILHLGFAQRRFRRGLGDKVEDARRIAGTIHGTAHAAQNFNLLELLKSGRRGHRNAHSIHAVALHVGSLHSAGFRPQNLGSLHLLEGNQGQILRDLLEVSRHRIVDQLAGNHIDRIRKVHDRRDTERRGWLQRIHAIGVLERTGRDAYGLRVSG